VSLRHINRKLKIVVLGASFSEIGNMGVNILSAGVVKLFLKRYPEAEIYFLDYGKEKLQYDLEMDGRTVRIELINIRFSKNPFLKNHIGFLLIMSLIGRLIPNSKWSSRFIQSNHVLKNIIGSDIFGAISGGDSFSDIYGLKRFFYVTLPQLLIVLLRKELILLPQTVGPFKGIFARAIARFILKRSKVIYSREKTRIRDITYLLGGENSKNKVKFCQDVGFLVESLRPKKLNILGFPEVRKVDSPIVGLNISGLLFMGGYSKDNMFRLKFKYSEFIYEMIEYLINRWKASVLLIPHVFGGPEEFESDSMVCSSLYGELKKKYEGNIALSNGVYNYAEIKYIIGLSEVFIGSRMHACIGALSQCVPAVGIAYSEKFYGVFESIGVGFLVADARQLNKNEVLGIVEETMKNKDDIKLLLARRIEEVREGIYSIFS
jgi:polysaccharide pyruvyl transferase WcaK-like protein